DPALLADPDLGPVGAGSARRRDPARPGAEGEHVEIVFWHGGSFVRPGETARATGNRGAGFDRLFIWGWLRALRISAHLKREPRDRADGAMRTLARQGAI